MGSINFKKLESLLSTNGKTFYSLRKDKVVGTETIKKLQQGYGFIDTRTIANLCEYLDCQPGDLMEYVPSQLDQSSLSSQHPQRQEPAATMTREPIPANGPSARIRETEDAEDLSESNPHHYETLEEKLMRMREAHVSRKD